MDHFKRTARVPGFLTEAEVLEAPQHVRRVLVELAPPHMLRLLFFVLNPELTGFVEVDEFGYGLLCLARGQTVEN